MKTLVLVRHAKSSWADPALADHERPLNKRGRRDAPAMAERLAKRKLRIDRVVCSTALRARETVEAFAVVLDIDGRDIVHDGRLYLAEPGEILDVVREQDDAHGTVLVCCHNPGVEELIERFTDDPPAKVRTCAVAEVTCGSKRWLDFGTEVVALGYMDPKTDPHGG